jgi:6-phosphogluconolactonase
VISLGLEAKSNNPSFLAVSPNNKFLYAANETDHFDDEATGAVSAFAIDRATGKLSALDAVSAKDSGPAYVSVDHSGKCVLIANYPRGSVAVYPVFEDGKLASASDFVRHKGSSVNPTRQRGPHAHAIALSPRQPLCSVRRSGARPAYRLSLRREARKAGNAAHSEDRSGIGAAAFCLQPKREVCVFDQRDEIDGHGFRLRCRRTAG